MKNVIFLFIVISLISCSQEKTEAVTRVQGVIPSNIGLYEIILDTENKTWRDLDFYYKNEVLKKHQDSDYFQSLSNTVFGHLVNEFKMLEEADTETLEFYINDQMKLGFINNPLNFLVTLDKLEPVWGKSKLKDIAQARYDKNIDYINTHFADPQKGLEHFGTRNRLLLGYASQLN